MLQIKKALQLLEEGRSERSISSQLGFGLDLLITKFYEISRNLSCIF